MHLRRRQQAAAVRPASAPPANSAKTAGECATRVPELLRTMRAHLDPVAHAKQAQKWQTLRHSAPQ